MKRLSVSIFELTRKKINSDSRVKNKNPFLKPDGGFDLIERFPVYVYESKKKREKRVIRGKRKK